MIIWPGRWGIWKISCVNTINTHRCWRHLTLIKTCIRRNVTYFWRQIWLDCWSCFSHLGLPDVRVFHTFDIELLYYWFSFFIFFASSISQILNELMSLVVRNSEFLLFRFWCHYAYYLHRSTQLLTSIICSKYRAHGEVLSRVLSPREGPLTHFDYRLIRNLKKSVPRE